VNYLVKYVKSTLHEKEKTWLAVLENYMATRC